MVHILCFIPSLYAFRHAHPESVSPRETLDEDLGVPSVGLTLTY